MIGPSVIVALEQATAAWVTGLSLCRIPQMGYESLTHTQNCPILGPKWDRIRYSVAQRLPHTVVPRSMADE
jgi:hypothetical protein